MVTAAPRARAIDRSRVPRSQAVSSSRIHCMRTGLPISRAIQLYGRTSPAGISKAFFQTACSNEVRPRQSTGTFT